MNTENNTATFVKSRAFGARNATTPQPIGRGVCGEPADQRLCCPVSTTFATLAARFTGALAVIREVSAGFCAAFRRRVLLRTHVTHVAHISSSGLSAGLSGVAKHVVCHTNWGKEIQMVGG